MTPCIFGDTVRVAVVYLCLGENLSLLALFQTGGESSHDMLLCTNHLHDLLIALHTHGLKTQRKSAVNKYIQTIPVSYNTLC